MIIIELQNYLKTSIAVGKSGAVDVLLNASEDGLDNAALPVINIIIGEERFDRPGGQNGFYSVEQEAGIQVITDREAVEKNITVCEAVKLALTSFQPARRHTLREINTETIGSLLIRTLTVYLTSQLTCERN